MKTFARRRRKPTAVASTYVKKETAGMEPRKRLLGAKGSGVSRKSSSVTNPPSASASWSAVSF
eukprot:scaffold265550_cov37-Tisochrysis_lutea.AAC.1